MRILMKTSSIFWLILPFVGLEYSKLEAYLYCENKTHTRKQGKR